MKSEKIVIIIACIAGILGVLDLLEMKVFGFQIKLIVVIALALVTLNNLDKLDFSRGTFREKEVDIYAEAERERKEKEFYTKLGVEIREIAKRLRIEYTHEPRSTIRSIYEELSEFYNKLPKEAHMAQEGEF